MVPGCPLLVDVATNRLKVQLRVVVVEMVATVCVSLSGHPHCLWIACFSTGLATSCWLSKEDTFFVTPCRLSSTPYLSSPDAVPLRWYVELVPMRLSSGLHHGRRSSTVDRWYCGKRCSTAELSLSLGEAVYYGGASLAAELSLAILGDGLFYWMAWAWCVGLWNITSGGVYLGRSLVLHYVIVFTTITTSCSLAFLQLHRSAVVVWSLLAQVFVPSQSWLMISHVSCYYFQVQYLPIWGVMWMSQAEFVPTLIKI